MMESQMPLNPGSRPRPLSNKEINGRNRLSKQISAAYDTPLPDDEYEEGIMETQGDSRKSTEPMMCGTYSCDDEESLRLCVVRVKSGYNPVLFFSIAYFAAAALFLLTVNLPVLPDLLFPTIGNLLPVRVQHLEPDRVVLLIAMWGIHYVKRFAEVLFVHIYKRQIPLYEAVGSVVYYGLFGFWVGWSLNYHIGYLTPPDSIFVPGILAYICGETGNFISHLQLRRFRTVKNNKAANVIHHPKSRHVIPYGGCFNFISCPHYLFEIVTWLGFALASFSLASWVFFAASTANILWYSYKKHKAYREEFDGQEGSKLYPENRKAIIPFIW